MLSWACKRVFSSAAAQPRIYSAAATRESEFRRILFHLPQLKTDTWSSAPPAFLLKQADFQAALQPIAEKSDASENIEPLLKSITSLSFQSRKFINKHNLHQARSFFASSPNDTGSVEVQCGQLTSQMIWMGEHCSKNRHDYKAQRKLVELVARRKKLLRYLRTVSLERFYHLLDQLSLPPNYLESLDNRYNFKYRK